MSLQNTSLLALPVKAAGSITKFRFIGTDGNLAAAGANTQGVSRNDASTGDVFPADCIGTVILETNGAFNAGDALQSDTGGKAIVKGAGVTTARALQASTGAGQFVEAFYIAN